MLAATPGSAVPEIGERGGRIARWQDLELIVHRRRFLERPKAYLRHLV